MTVLDRVRSAWRVFTGRAITWENTVDALRVGGGPVSSGVRVNEWNALTLSAWWAATRIIAEAVASVPLIIYRRSGEGKDRATNHPLYDLLHDQPNPEMTSMVWRETMQAHILSWGNAYAEIVRNGAGRVVEIWPLPPDQTTPKRDPQTKRLYYEFLPGDGPAVRLAPERVLHVPGLGYDGLMGYSVARMARESIGLGLATEQAGGTHFGSGMRPAGGIKVKRKLSPEGKANLREGFERMHGGANAGKRVAILEEDMDWVPFSMSPEDSQFLEIRQFQREEVALWFNLPPFKLGVSGTATYASAEQFAVDFVVHTLRPWWVRWEQEIKRKLFTPSERKTYFAEHLADALLRGDAASRTQALLQQFLHGAVNLDEWRAAENRNPLPDGLGQVHFVPMNVQPVERALEEPEPPPEPAPPAAGPEEEPEDEPTPEPSANGDARGTRLLAAEQEVWRDAMWRICRRDADAAKRAAKSPHRFLPWLEEYGDGAKDVYIKTLLPAVKLTTARTGDDPHARAAAVAEERWRQVRTDLLDVAGQATPAELEAKVAARVDRWEVDLFGSNGHAD